MWYFEEGDVDTQMHYICITSKSTPCKPGMKRIVIICDLYFYQLMDALCLESGSFVSVYNIKLPAGKKCILQPHASAFTKLSNPKTVYDYILKRVVCYFEDGGVVL